MTSTVTVRYAVIDGADGQALAQRQAAAIRYALAWLAVHPDLDETTDQHHSRKLVDLTARTLTPLAVREGPDQPCLGRPRQDSNLRPSA